MPCMKRTSAGVNCTLVRSAAARASTTRPPSPGAPGWTMAARGSLLLRQEDRTAAMAAAASHAAAPRTTLLTRLLAQEPSCQAERGQPDHAALEHALAGAVRRLALDQRAIDLRLG